MTLKEIIHETAKAVKTIKYLSGVPVVEEEKGDLTAERQKKIGQSKVCVQVGWNGTTRPVFPFLHTEQDKHSQRKPSCKSKFHSTDHRGIK